MKKIPTLFQREFNNHRVVKVLPELSDSSLSWVLAGEGVATEKIDGACCAFLGDKFYKRYDAKRDRHGIQKKPPAGAIPCCPPDPVTGHWPHWVRCTDNDSEGYLFLRAFMNHIQEPKNGTYEAIGPHFNGNPYCLDLDYVVPHGKTIIDLPDRSFEGIRAYLEAHAIEGIVFWKDDQPQCKIKRSDFGIPWPDKEHLANLQHYVYQIEAEQAYIDLLKKISADSDMTVEEMTVLGLQYVVSHPEVLLRWQADLNTQPEQKQIMLRSVRVTSITPVYSDELWLEQHTGGTI